MAKWGMPGLASGDTKAPSPLSSGHKQIAAQMLPSRHSMAQITGGDPVQRTMNNYAKQTPAADPASTAAMNINSLPMMQP